MIKKLILLCCLFLAILYSCDQKPNTTISDSKNDSVKKYLELASNDTLAYDKRIQYNDKAYSFIDLSRNDTISISSLYKTTNNFYRFNDLTKLRVASNLMIKKALLLKNNYWIALGYKTKGLYFMNNSENEKAIFYFFKAKKILSSINKDNDIITVLNNISLTQYYAGDFLGSNKTAFEILRSQKKLKNKISNENLYNQIGNNLANLKQDDKALEYYKKATKLKISFRFKQIITNNMSSSYIEIGNYKNAYDELNSIVQNKKYLKINPNYYAASMSLLGYCYLKMNKLNGLPNIFFEAEKIFKKNNSTNGRNYNFIYLSMYYEKNNDVNNAILNAKKAVELSREYKNPSDIMYSLKQLIKVDKFNASKNAQEYICVNDRMQIAERNFRDKFARIAYETDEISQEKDKAIHQKWVITGIAVTVILIIVLLLIITHQRTKQKELQLLQEQQKANEEIYQLMLTQKAKEDAARQTEKKRIALELHDGIMNKLASTRLNLAVLSHKTDKATIDNCITHVNDIYKIEQEIRLVSHDLNQEVFQQEDSFIKIVEDFVKEQNHNHKTHFELEIDSELDWKKISSEIKMHLFRIIQEASYNISKYAQAKKATISLVLDSPNICMSIRDDGIGFDTSATPKGIGIQNMKVRVKLLKGKFTINSSAKTITSINIAIPI